jgi:hypothetical protein
MSDYTNIDSTCVDWIPWQQYQASEPVVNFFTWFQGYLQETYFDAIESTYMPALGVYNNSTEYLEFYSKYVLGILRPLDITGTTRWDSGYPWDDVNKWDMLESAGKISIESFRKMLLCIIDWANHDWSMVYLFDIVHNFTDIDYADITIVQNSTNLDLVTITLATSTESKLFKTLIENYKSYWGIPLGISLSCTLS